MKQNHFTDEQKIAILQPCSSASHTRTDSTSVVTVPIHCFWLPPASAVRSTWTGSVATVAARSGATIGSALSRRGPLGVSTSYLHGAHVRASRDTSIAHDPEIVPFLSPWLRLWMLRDEPDGRSASFRSRPGEDARAGALGFQQAGLTLALGSDDPGFPDGLHGELAEVVTAGLTPSDALVAATSAAARVLDIDGDVGTIAVGKIADLVLLDADPLTDIRNTRRIWRVIQAGRIVDRAALRSAAIQGN